MIVISDGICTPAALIIDGSQVCPSVSFISLTGTGTQAVTGTFYSLAYFRIKLFFSGILLLNSTTFNKSEFIHLKPGCLLGSKDKTNHVHLL